MCTYLNKQNLLKDRANSHLDFTAVAINTRQINSQVMHETCIREVPASNLGRRNRQPHRVFLYCSQSSLEQYRVRRSTVPFLSTVRRNRFLPNPQNHTHTSSGTGAYGTSFKDCISTAEVFSVEFDGDMILKA